MAVLLTSKMDSHRRIGEVIVIVNTIIVIVIISTNYSLSTIYILIILSYYLALRAGCRPAVAPPAVGTA